MLFKNLKKTYKEKQAMQAARLLSFLYIWLGMNQIILGSRTCLRVHHNYLTVLLLIIKLLENLLLKNERLQRKILGFLLIRQLISLNWIIKEREDWQFLFLWSRPTLLLLAIIQILAITKDLINMQTTKMSTNKINNRRKNLSINKAITKMRAVQNWIQL